jgi:hypothetical protein
VTSEKPYRSWVSGRMLEWHDEPGIEHRLWPQQKTFKPLLEVLERLARTHRTGGGRQFSDAQLRGFAHLIHGAIRDIGYSQLARDIRQKNVPVTRRSSTRLVLVGWRKAAGGPATQLRRLMSATGTEEPSTYKLEQAWRGLTPAARSLLQLALDDARTRDLIRSYKGPITVEPAVLSHDLPAPQLLRLVLPFALARARNYRDSPMQQAKDAAVTQLVTVFMTLSGRRTDGLVSGQHQGPTGPGADFIWEIERIFGVDLLSKCSLHGVRRARRLRMAQGR